MGKNTKNPCPHCGSYSRIRTSKILSDLSREKYYQCTNDACAYEYRSVETIVSTIRESFKPKPEVQIPTFVRKWAPAPTG